MTKTRLQVFALAAVLCAVGTVSGVARGAADTTLADIAGYREWTRVTEAPTPVDLPSPTG